MKNRWMQDGLSSASCRVAVSRHLWSSVLNAPHLRVSLLAVPFRKEQYSFSFQEPVELRCFFWQNIDSKVATVHHVELSGTLHHTWALFPLCAFMGRTKTCLFKHALLHSEFCLNEQEEAEEQMNRSRLAGSVLAVNSPYHRDGVVQFCSQVYKQNDLFKVTLLTAVIIISWIRFCFVFCFFVCFF